VKLLELPRRLTQARNWLQVLIRRSSVPGPGDYLPADSGVPDCLALKGTGNNAAITLVLLLLLLRDPVMDFFPVNLDILGCIYADSDLGSFYAHYSDSDILVDHQRFSNLAR